VPYLGFLTAAVLFFFLYKRGIQRWEAAAILAIYCIYVFIKLTLSFTQ
jgi:Ca2+/Na+ antiporter